MLQASPCAWMVTGGVGALGALSASWLALQQHPASLCLLGRSGRASAHDVPRSLCALLGAACAALVTVARYAAPLLAVIGAICHGLPNQNAAAALKLVLSTSNPIQVRLQEHPLAEDRDHIGMTPCLL